MFWEGNVLFLYNYFVINCKKVGKFDGKGFDLEWRLCYFVVLKVIIFMKIFCEKDEIVSDFVL